MKGERSAPGRIRTYALRLRTVALISAELRERVEKKYPWQDLHPHWLASEASVSALDYKGEKLKRYPRGRIRTRTGLVLNQVPLLVGLRREIKENASGRTCTRNLRVRSAALCLLSYESRMI